MNTKGIYVLGLTGSIGMGKSVASSMFKKLGVPVFDSDAEVHKIYNEDETLIAKIRELFPEAVEDGKISRPKLGKIVFGNSEMLEKLEKLIHPLIRFRQKRFIKSSKFRGKKLVVLDIPLLFENDAQSICDGVALVTAPPDIQRERVLSRPDMAEEKFKNILKSQISDDEKRKRADFIIPSHYGFESSFNEICTLVRMLKRKMKKKPKPQNLAISI